MMHAPATAAARRQQADSKRLTGVSRGLNASDPIDGMRPDDLLVGANVICRSDGIHTRDGWVQSVTGMVGAVQTVAWHPAGHFIAATPTKLYRTADMGGAAIEIATHANGWWSTDVMSNPGGAHLLMCNGIDTPKTWTGTALITNEITAVDHKDAPDTGLDPTRLHMVAVHGNYAFYAERESLNVWYLEHFAIKGKARKLPLAPMARMGGEIAAIASFSSDGGRSANDMFIAITDKGEGIVFAGSNPRNASTWKLVGVYNLGKPVGRRCFDRSGPSLRLITEDGVIDVRRAMAAAKEGKDAATLTDRISGLWEDAHEVNGEGWAIVSSANAKALIIQRPDKAQFAADGERGSWSTWHNLDAVSWCETPDGLFFGRSDGKIGKMGGGVDNGAPIDAIIGHAYQEFGTAGRKLFNRVRLRFTRAIPSYPRVELFTDHRALPAIYTAASIGSGYRLWADMTWSQTPCPWLKEGVTERDNLWRGITGRGHAAALMIAFKTRNKIIYRGADIMFTQGSSI